MPTGGEPLRPTRLGKYELLMELAAGGMASVHVARHKGGPGASPHMERLVAIKWIHKHLLGAPHFREMFQDEARVASLIRHPNVVRLLDVGEDDDELYLVLDYVESASLSSLLRETASAEVRLPPAVVSRIVADALLGLEAAHDAVDARGRSLDVVHRDVSPQNIIVGVDGASHVIDFGIATASARLTETTGGAIKGKVAYMSPEQARGVDLDRRSDVFSAGVVLFEALTGKSLFGAEGGDAANVILKILLDSVDPPSVLAPGVSPAVDVVVERALERVRDERYQTARELHDALVAAIPPATAREVADVVDRYCGPVIRARRDTITRKLEALDEVASAELAATRGAPTLRPELPGTPSKSRLGWKMWLVLSVVVSGGAVAAALIWRHLG